MILLTLALREGHDGTYFVGGCDLMVMVKWSRPQGAGGSSLSIIQAAQGSSGT